MASQVPSLKEIKDALPAKCFQANTLYSLYYVAREVVFVSGLYFFLHTVRNSWVYENTALYALCLGLYIFLQGTVFWGIFVLGHDCGHSSFSKYPWLNWVVGNFLHSYILCPYESWRITHCHHHKNTGSIENDEIFFPMRTDSTTTKEDRAHLDFARKLGFAVGTAWWIYLGYGFSPRNVPHLSLKPALFQNRQKEVAASIASVGVVATVMVMFALQHGFWTLFIYQLAPLFVFSCWLVVTTFLHHNDEDTPWYDNSQWDYVKGNLSSIDRSYGIFDNIIHDIGTHQVHHLFPVIPHYNLREATRAFRKAFPQHVRVQSTSIVGAFIKTLRQYVAYGTFEGREGETKVWRLRDEIRKRQAHRDGKHQGDAADTQQQKMQKKSI